jgi:hypothetical protein
LLRKKFSYFYLKIKLAINPPKIGNIKQEINLAIKISFPRKARENGKL